MKYYLAIKRSEGIIVVSGHQGGDIPSSWISLLPQTNLKLYTERFSLIEIQKLVEWSHHFKQLKKYPHWSRWKRLKTHSHHKPHLQPHLYNQEWNPKVQFLPKRVKGLDYIYSTSAFKAATQRFSNHLPLRANGACTCPTGLQQTQSSFQMGMQLFFKAIPQDQPRGSRQKPPSPKFFSRRNLSAYVTSRHGKMQSLYSPLPKKIVWNNKFSEVVDRKSIYKTQSHFLNIKTNLWERNLENNLIYNILGNKFN